MYTQKLGFYKNLIRNWIRNTGGFVTFFSKLFKLLGSVCVVLSKYCGYLYNTLHSCITQLNGIKGNMRWQTGWNVLVIFTQPLWQICSIHIFWTLCGHAIYYLVHNDTPGVTINLFVDHCTNTQYVPQAKQNRQTIACNF